MYSLLDFEAGSTEEFSGDLRAKVEAFAAQILGEKTDLRQVFVKQKDPEASLLRIVERPLFPESKNACLVRKHTKGSSLLTEDWLDYQKESLVY